MHVLSCCIVVHYMILIYINISKSSPQLTTQRNTDRIQVTSFLPKIVFSTTLLPPHTKQVTYLLTYLLTPRSSVLLEKLTGLQLVKKFPALYGTWRFITIFTSARHLSLSWANSIQSPPPPTSQRSILILSSHLRLGLPNGLFPSGTKQLNST